MKETLICWDTDPPVIDALVEQINHFNARGMRRVYIRGDLFGRGYNFQMDIWLTRNGRLLMRCWSRCSDIDGCSFEIKGMATTAIPWGEKETELQESAIPGAVREAYDEWVKGEF
jgi:hypothetical protein